ncbi:MAG: flagellar motor protein MotB [Zetaproteobacteria bacterium]|nr:flagellar motor protein MotB [Zetaproteobacteria bacterium]
MGKKHKCPEFENHERWLVSYADMLTLLFAVFVVLYALKEGGDPSIQNAAGSMQESFNTPLDDIPLDRISGKAERGYGVFENFRGDHTVPSNVDQPIDADPDMRIINEELSHIETVLEQRLYGPENYPDQKESGFERIVNISLTRSGFRLKLVGQHFYAPGATTMSPKALRDFDVIAEALKDLDRNIVIQGHSDSIPETSNSDPWDISARRATEIVRYMIRKHRFPAHRLAAVGYGDTRPMAHNGTAAGRKLNRRLEIHVEYDRKIWMQSPE